MTVRGLVKRYGRREAVFGVDLDVHQGEIFAFLGPNGAGKTTTVEILEGFRERTEGDVCVLGVDPADAGGAWRDRVDVALALMGDPDIVFLDEPTTGFDPAARRAAWEVIAGLRQLGKTIFLTTHFMEEAEYLADRIAVIAGGKIIAEGTPKTLGGRDRMTATIRFTLPARLAVRDLPAGLRPLAETVAGGAIVVRSESPLVHLRTLATGPYTRVSTCPTWTFAGPRSKTST